ncbi:MAG TPA: protein kinase, partial [Myxococcota bacterium]
FFPTADTKRKVSGEIDMDAEEAEATDDARFNPGERILGHYTVVRQLGRGGMGTVYLARDDVSGQEVAVKVLPASLARERDIRDRFTQEARALASMDHQNIVPLITYAQEGEDRFLVMKYLQGEPLDARLRRLGVLPPEHARKVLRAVLAALGYAHGRHVIHRDVKPSNVIIDGDLDGEHRVFLVDFGIAKKDVGDKRLTQTGMLMGTPQYMSPEQISGHPVDGRSDIYAAGLVLFEMLTGRPPFDGQKTFQVLRAHVEQPVPDVVQARGGPVPEDILSLVYLLLRKSPDERPNTALDAIGLLDGTTSYPLLEPERALVPQPSSPPSPGRDHDSAPATRLNVGFPQHLAEATEDALNDPSAEELAIALPRRGRRLLAALALLVVGAGAAVLLLKPWRGVDIAALGGSVDSGVVDPGSNVDRVDRAAMMLLMQTARSSFKSGDYAHAFNEIEAAVGEMPNDTDAISLQVDVRTAMGMLDDADKALAVLKQHLSDAGVDPSVKLHVPEQEALIAQKRAQKKSTAEAAAAKADAERAAAAQAKAHTSSQSSPVSNAAVLKAALTTRVAVSTCYVEHVQAKDPSAIGELTVTVKIAPTGRVDEAKATASKGGRLFEDNAFRRCVEGEIHKWKFAKWKGDPTAVPYTMSFRPIS